MALINCPECGKQISDKAKRCIHCDADIYAKQEDIKTLGESFMCQECGEKLSDENEFCPNCGCPIQDNENVLEDIEQDPQKVEVTKVKLLSSTNKKMILCGMIGLVIISLFFSVMSLKKIEYYRSNLISINTAMRLNVEDATEVGTLIRKVWHDAIYDERNEETKKYTQKAKDFNDALKNLFSDEIFAKKLIYISGEQDIVNKKMKILSNPPRKFKETYSALQELHKCYLELTDLALNPTGTLITYTNSYNNALNNFNSLYKSFQVYVDN